jgi:hypothetical protein
LFSERNGFKITWDISKKKNKKGFYLLILTKVRRLSLGFKNQFNNILLYILSPEKISKKSLKNIK